MLVKLLWSNTVRYDQQSMFYLSTRICEDKMFQINDEIVRSSRMPMRIV